MPEDNDQNPENNNQNPEDIIKSRIIVRSLRRFDPVTGKLSQYEETTSMAENSEDGIKTVRHLDVIITESGSVLDPDDAFFQCAGEGNGRGNLVKATEGFMCSGCHLFFGIKHLAKEESTGKIRTIRSTIQNQPIESTIPEGENRFCKRCWRKTLFLRILFAPIRLLAKLLLTALGHGNAETRSYQEPETNENQGDTRRSNETGPNN